MTPNNRSKKVVVISHDVAGKTMAGPGIRYVAVAQELAKHFDVTLGLFNGTKQQQRELAQNNDFQVATFTKKKYEQLLEEHDYIFAQQLSRPMFDFARRKQKRIILDLYAPMPIEALAFHYFSVSGLDAGARNEYRNLISTYRYYLSVADYFVCSNERQRDMWFGFMAAQGLLAQRNESFTEPQRLIGLAPMGIESESPEHKNRVLRDNVEGIEEDDFILLWTGGLWDWFDPLTVVKAVEAARQNNSKIKLVFLGTRHPNAKMPEMQTAQETIRYVKRHGLEDNSILFIDEWLPFEERVNYLLEADAAIYAHKKSLETRFSHRSRVLDHIYAELPTIATPGDYLSDELVGKQEFGLLAAREVDGLAEAIQQLATDDNLCERIKSNIAAHREEFFWENTLEDLVAFIGQSSPQSPLEAVETPDSTTSSGLVFNARRVIRKIKHHVR